MMRPALGLIGLLALGACSNGAGVQQPYANAHETLVATLGSVSQAKFVEVISGKASAGDTNVSISPDFDVRNGSVKRSTDVLQSAFADARIKAETLAKAAGLRLGGVQEIVQEVGGIVPVSAGLKGNMSALGARVNVSPDAPIAVVVRYGLVGGSGSIEVVGLAAVPSSQSSSRTRTDRMMVGINLSARTGEEALARLHRAETAVFDGLHSLGITDSQVEHRDFGISVTKP